MVSVCGLCGSREAWIVRLSVEIVGDGVLERCRSRRGKVAASSDLAVASSGMVRLSVSALFSNFLDSVTTRIGNEITVSHCDEFYNGESPPVPSLLSGS